MVENLISGFIYSKYKNATEVKPYCWSPKDLNEDLSNIVALKTRNLLRGERDIFPKDIIIIPFSSFKLKGILKYIKLADEYEEDKVCLSSLVVLFEEHNDLIFYKYIQELEKEFNLIAGKIKKIEESTSTSQQICLNIEKWVQLLIDKFNDLKSIELSKKELALFPEECPHTDAAPLYITKIIVSGNAAVGKTSLILRFTDNAFKRVYIPTLGVNITEKTICIRKKYRIRLIIWDVAGQDKFKIMRKHFYLGAEGLLLVFDLTVPGSLEALQKWYEDIVNFTNKEDFYGYILGNKKDLSKHIKVKSNSVKEVSQKLGFKYFETSALTGDNVELVFQKLAEDYFKLKGMLN
ncbi:MAG: GTP-binding protein [Candidatus Lokiarchaeota archaeon]|nr:GTP-binding protein [Candidatus Lokiarchaeota archaeon]